MSAYGALFAVAAVPPWAIVAAEATPDATWPTLFAQLGLSAVFLWMWWQERKERQSLQATLYQLVERLAPLFEQSTSALKEVQSSMAQQVERVAPHRNLGTEVDRLEEIVTLLMKQQGDSP